MSRGEVFHKEIRSHEAQLISETLFLYRNLFPLLVFSLPLITYSSYRLMLSIKSIILMI